MIEELTNEIVGRLKKEFPEYEAESFPDNPESYNFLHPIAALLVRYDSARYEERPSMNGPFMQKVTLVFDVTIACRALAGNGGAYALLDRAKSALFGFKPDVGEPLTLRTDGFRAREKEVWYYGITAETKVLGIKEE